MVFVFSFVCFSLSHLGRILNLVYSFISELFVCRGERVETSVVLIAKVDGTFSAGRAQIGYMYTDENDNLEERELTSSTFGRTQIVTENTYKRITNDFFVRF